MLIRRLLKFARLTFVEKLLLLEAALFMALVRPAILLLPFRWIAPLLGHERLESPLEISPAQVFKARQIGWAVVTMSYRTFWQATCLVQAVAAQLMLKRRGISGTIYLGAIKDKENKLLAHAWVRCGCEILTGASGSKQFTVIATFAPNSASLPAYRLRGKASRE